MCTRKSKTLLYFQYVGSQKDLCMLKGGGGGGGGGGGQWVFFCET